MPLFENVSNNRHSLTYINQESEIHFVVLKIISLEKEEK